MKFVKCIDARGYQEVINGGVYEVLTEVPRMYALVGKANGSLAYDKKDFEEIAAPPAEDRALRFNQGKPELFYADMFPLALREVCRTLEFGTKRPKNPYPRFNWCKGAPFTELYNCARRHMTDWLTGKTLDADAKEQGFEINNLAFTIGNLLRLLEQELAGKTELDDRYKP